MKINKDSINDACFDLADLLRKKNADYGDSFEKQYDEYGLTSVVIRLEDKLNRLKYLLKNDANVHESVEDTLKDIAGYGLLGSVVTTKHNNIIINDAIKREVERYEKL